MLEGGTCHTLVARQRRVSERQAHEDVRSRLLLLACAMLMPASSSGAGAEAERGVVPAPPAECEAKVGYDRDAILPGYLIPTSAGPRTCIPFSSVGARPPPDYRGDFYVDEFSDVALRKRWAECRRDDACRERVLKPLLARRPPNREFGTTDQRHIHLLGKVGEGDIDLRTVRRPAFFARAPYSEPIAQVEDRTFTVEFAAPRDPYERIHEKMSGSVRLRGWYIRGDGVDDGKGGRRRALIVMTTGGGGRIAAISHPADRLYRINPDGTTSINDFPNETSAATGQDLWRRTAMAFHDAGFDVLLFDRRGVGISDGYSDTNTLQQGRDLLLMVASLRSGEGLRALTPAGARLKGRAAAAALRRGDPDGGLPVLLMGNSRGTMSSGWAMTINFHKDCTYDLPQIRCAPPRGDASIKGALLLAEFTSGPGYVMSTPSDADERRGLGRDRPLFIGANQVELNTVFFPSSAILAGIHTWPAAFFARGLWDYAAALEGTVESYRRVIGPKELVVIRAPHPYEVWPEPEQRRVQERMVQFARAIILGKSDAPRGRPWRDMKELVATSSDIWEPSTKPTLN